MTLKNLMKQLNDAQTNDEGVSIISSELAAIVEEHRERDQALFWLFERCRVNARYSAFMCEYCKLASMCASYNPERQAEGEKTDD